MFFLCHLRVTAAMGLKVKLFLFIVLPGCIALVGHQYSEHITAWMQSKLNSMTKSAYTGPNSCCRRLQLSGTHLNDSFYQDIQGTFTPLDSMLWLEYKKSGFPDVDGRYPVYSHAFENFIPTEERKNPPTAFIYYYRSENPNVPDAECGKKGCWIVSMFDATPDNYWFGQKWFWWKTKLNVKCVEELSSAEGLEAFNKVDGKEEELKISCVQ